MNKVCFIDIKGINWFLFRSSVRGLKIKQVKSKNKILDLGCKFYIITDCFEVEIDNDMFDKLMNDLF